MVDGEVRRIGWGDADCPAILSLRLDDAAPRSLNALGDMAVMHNRLVGLVCSIRCPGSIVIKAFDTIRELRDAGVVVIGDFHSPMERQCLDILLMFVLMPGIITYQFMALKEAVAKAIAEHKRVGCSFAAGSGRMEWSV
jgi:hypothetical protein